MTGKLYVLGVGPGDPELITLKAVRIMKEAVCICVPKGREEGTSLALSIAEKAVELEEKEIIEIHFPMKKTKSDQVTELDNKWNQAVEIILDRLNCGKDMVFLTIGDPTLYSTFFYLYDKLLTVNPELDIEIVPGVSSVNASSARAKISLGIADERIAILPANYSHSLQGIIERFDTVLLMKVHKVFADIVETLTQMNLLKNAVYISRAGMEDEKIFTNILDVKQENLNYFSTVIVRK